MKGRDSGVRYGTAALLQFAFPTIMAVVLGSVYSVVDGFFVSNYAGKTAFSALNLIFPLIMILGSSGLMLGTGGSALVANARGAGREHDAQGYFSLLVYATIALGVLLACVGVAVVEPVAALMGATGVMLSYCRLYGSILVAFMPVYMLQFSMQSFFAAAEKPSLSFVFSMGAGLVNLVLDYCLIVLLGWGLAGAAVATGIGMVVGGFGPLLYFAFPNKSCFRLGRPIISFRLLGKSCFNGSSEMVTEVANSLVSIVYNYQLLRFFGEDGIAAFGVVMYVGAIFSGVFVGFAMGTAPLMSFQDGSGNSGEMRNLFKRSVTISFVVGILMFALSQIFAVPLVSLFVGYEGSTEALGIYAMRCYSLVFLFMGFNIYSSALFTSLGNGVVSAIVSFARTIVFEIGGVVTLPLLFGMGSLWYATFFAEICSVVMNTLFIVRLGPRYGFVGRRERRLKKSGIQGKGDADRGSSA